MPKTIGSDIYQQPWKQNAQPSVANCESLETLQIKYDRLKSNMNFCSTLDTEIRAREFLDAERERNNQRYLRYAEFLSKADICMLDSIEKDESKDLEYIRTCLSQLYKENTAILEGKSLRGKMFRNSKVTYKNEALSPLKVNMIHELFKERVVLSKDMVTERCDTAYINTRITNSLSYLKTKLRKKK